MAETVFTLSEASVPSQWLWSCYFKVTQVFNVTLLNTLNSEEPFLDWQPNTFDVFGAIHWVSCQEPGVNRAQENEDALWTRWRRHWVIWPESINNVCFATGRRIVRSVASFPNLYTSVQFDLYLIRNQFSFMLRGRRNMAKWKTLMEQRDAIL